LNIDKVIDFSFSPFGEKIIVSNGDGFCSIRKTPINNTITIKTDQNNLVSSPDYFFALANKTEPIIKKISDFLNNQGYPNQPPSISKSYKISPDGKLILTTLDGSLRLWCATTENWIATLGDKFASPFIECSFSTDGFNIISKVKSNEELIYLSQEKKYSNNN
jgi:hypothetical protein